MAQYDGAIRINTKIDTKGAKVQLSALRHTIVKTAEEIASLRSKMDALKDVKVPTKEFADLESELKKAVSEYDKLRAKMDEPGKPTEEYKSLQKQLQKAQSELKRLAEQQAEMEGMGLPLTQESINQLADASDRVDALKEKMQSLESNGKAFVPKVDPKDLDDAKKKVDELKQKIKELKSSGKDFQWGQDTDEYKSLERQLGYEQKALAKMKFQSAALGGFDKIGKIKGSFKKLGETAKKAFSKVDKSAKKSSGSISSFGSRIKGLVMSALIFNQISKAFNAMISGMKEGFGNLYNEVGGFKSSVDGLKASMLTLKNSFAAAFRPLVEIAIPYIQSAIDALASLINMIGQFTAAVTGQKTYTKAVRQTAEAWKDAGKAAKGYLGPLDEVNKYDISDNAGSGGGASDKMFEENVPIESGILDIADRIKEIFSGIFDVFKRAWVDKGEAVIKSAKAAFGSIIDVVKAIGSTFYEVFTNGTGLLWAESFLDFLRSALDIIHSIASSFAEAWNSGAGFEHVAALFEMLMDVNNLLSMIGDSFSRAFSNGIGTEIWANLLGILTGIYDTIGNIAEQITIAWTAAGTGDGIWNGILNIANIILGTIHDIIDSTAIWASTLDFTPLLQSISDLLQSLQPLSENIGAGLQWFWDNVLLPIAGWAIEDAVPAFLDMLSTAIDALNAILEVFKPIGEWLWNDLLQPLAEWTGDLVISAIETITDLLEGFGSWISDNKELVEDMVLVIGSFFTAWTAVKLASVITGIVGALATFVATGGLAAAVAGLLGGAIAFLTSPVTLVVAAIGALIAIGVLLYKNWDTIKEKAIEIWGAIRDWFKETIERIKEFFSGLWKGIKETFANVGSWFKEKFEGAVTGIKNAFSSVGDFFSGVWKGIKDAFGNIAGWFKDKFSAAWEAVKNVFSKGGKIFDGIKDGILNGLKTVINGIIDGINKVISIPFKGLNTALEGIKSVSIAGFKPFDWLPTIDVPQIPRLATGAVIPANKEFLAVLGDQKHGTNIEAPLDTIKQATEESLLNVLSRIGMSGGNGGGTPVNLTLQVVLDKRVLGQAMVDWGKLQQMATGNNPYDLGTT